MLRPLHRVARFAPHQIAPRSLRNVEVVVGTCGNEGKALKDWNEGSRPQSITPSNIARFLTRSFHHASSSFQPLWPSHIHCDAAHPFNTLTLNSLHLPARRFSSCIDDWSSTFHSATLNSLHLPARRFSSCIDDGSSNKPDPVTGMTPKMVKLLKCLSSVVKPDGQTHGANIFKMMFKMDINIQRMFPKFACDDMCALDRNPAFQKHVDTVMKSLLNLMDNSGSVPDLRASLAVLIKIHKDLCIPPKHFITLGNALNDYLKETLGVKYSEDVECAVAYFWKYVVQEMTVQPIRVKCSKCGCTILKEC